MTSTIGCQIDANAAASPSDVWLTSPDTTQTVAWHEVAYRARVIACHLDALDLPRFSQPAVCTVAPAVVRADELVATLAAQQVELAVPAGDRHRVVRADVVVRVLAHGTRTISMSSMRQ